MLEDKMSDSILAVEYAGLKLRNPLLIAAGPWNRDSDRMLRGLNAGASAVITPTIVSEASPLNRPRLHYSGNQLTNIKLYSEMTLEDWKRNIGEVKEAGGTVIASIMGETSSEIVYLAETIERFGADALEIGAASPLGEGVEIKCADPDYVFEYTNITTKSVSIPVTVKLSATVTNPVACAKAAENGGAAGISGIDAVRSLTGFDIESRRPLLPSIGGLSGASIKPISLALISMVSKAVQIPVCGIGGISGFSDVIEYFLAGASAVQIGSSIFTLGVDNLSRIIDEIHEWLSAKRIQNISELSGKASRKLMAMRDLRTAPLSAGLKTKCVETECLKCKTACMYDAVDLCGGEIEISADKCTGCGICVGLCPAQRITLSWHE